MRVLVSATMLIACCALAACSVTAPVRGSVQATKETFTGTATGYLDGAGTLQVLSSKGVDCRGNFVYVTERTGEGVFTCSDGRSGPFKFASTGSKGTGTGMLDNDRFIFTFGD